MGLLYNLVEDLMEDCGFPEEMYIIREEHNDVVIEVDQKKAASYILKIAEEDQYKKHMIGIYSKNKKRHKILFTLW